MSVPAAFAVIVLIWSTTPLAVKWSGEGPGFLLGAFGRMTLATLLCLCMLVLLRIPLPWHKQARQAYVAAAIGVYGAMMCVYWSAQYIPSGLIAVLFGLTPIMTGLLASIGLKERSMTPAKITGMLLGVLGLLIIFETGFDLGPRAFEGIAVMMLSVFLHSLSTVFVKRNNAELAGITVASGGLLLSLPLYALTWLIADGSMPQALPTRAMWSIVYLGIIGSAVGFTLYYYVLKHVAANGAVLMTLLSPVLALLLGNTINNEHIGIEIWFGSLLVLSGLALHQWGAALFTTISRQRSPD